MARIVMSICDWCKNEISGDNTSSIVLKCGNDKPLRGEICPPCVKNISGQLQAGWKIKAEKPADSAQLSKPDIVPSANKTPIANKKKDCSTCGGEGYVVSGHNGDIRDCSECKKKNCGHDRISWEENSYTCKDCGFKKNTWKP